MLDQAKDKRRTRGKQGADEFRNGAGSKRRRKRPAPPRNAPEWFDRLQFNMRGEPYANLANAITALEAAPEFAGALAFDEFAMKPWLARRPPWESEPWAPREWSDVDDICAADWLQRCGLNVAPFTVGQAVQKIAYDNRFHPVRDYLDGLTWDEEPRLYLLLPAYFGADDTPYSRAVGAMALISAVARIRKPGCQADHVLILEGKQGSKKSTGLRILGGPWFTDEMADFGSKDAAMQVRGVLIIEVSELDALQRGSTSKLKAFISRRVDRFRPPYGARLTDSPRQCIFIGTTNEACYLTDDTGNRRFWPVRTGVIDTEALERDRDQLWAEAQARYRKGDRWWLSGKLLAEAREQQEDRREDDAFTPLVEMYLTGLPPGADTSVTEVLTLGLNRQKAQWTRAEETRIGKILWQLGWSSYRPRRPADQPDQPRPRRYRKG
jgi:predicted P-loop ATPase